MTTQQAHASSRGLALWAKMAPQADGFPRYHPLICHMIDAASVAAVLWDHALCPSLRRRSVGL